jgi:hypothetical protein
MSKPIKQNGLVLRLGIGIGIRRPGGTGEQGRIRNHRHKAPLPGANDGGRPMKDTHRPWAARLALGICVLTALSALIAGAAPAAKGAGPQKLNRQIDVMARIIDKALIDSPNLLVSSDPNCTGFLLPDYGVIFTFEASLVRDLPDGDMFIGPGSFEIHKSGGDRTIIIHKKEAGLHRLFGGKNDKDDVKDEPVRKPSEVYAAGRDELVQALVDYAETLNALPSGQWVVLAAKMNNVRTDDDQKIHRLLLRARTDDLKAFADERISESDMKQRVQIEES